MAVVGEMHVGKGREEKEKRKGRGSEGEHLTREAAPVTREMSEAAPVAREMREACTSRARGRAYRTRDAHSTLIPHAGMGMPLASRVRQARPRARDVCQLVRNSRMLGATC